jgi:endonuclease YncB( thermonuclease family)
MLLAFAAATTIISAGATFQCTPTAVWDGDGPIWCAEGPKIRLRGIAAREVRRVGGRVVDGGCKRGHPCGKAPGPAARDRLVGLLGGPRGTLASGHVRVQAATMRCRSYGGGKGARTAASCALPGVGDLSCAMVRAGAAVRWRSYGGAGVCG